MASLRQVLFPCVCIHACIISIDIIYRNFAYKHAKQKLALQNHALQYTQAKYGLASFIRSADATRRILCIALLAFISIKPQIAIPALQGIAYLTQIIFGQHNRAVLFEWEPTRMLRINVALLEYVLVVKYAHLAWRWMSFARRRPHKAVLTVFGGDSRELLVKDVVYSTSGRKLDWYTPEVESRHCKLPVVLFVYGGAWNSGNKEMYSLMASRLSQEGFIVVVPDYTLYPAARAEQMIQEIGEALKWTKKNLSNLIDENLIAIAGHSAGAHLAAMTVLQNPGIFKRFVGLAGVYDIQDHFGFEHQRAVEQASAMEPAMGGASRFEELSPLYVFRNVKSSKTIEAMKKTRFIMVHGISDQTVPISQSEIFYETLRSAGLTCDLHKISNCSHAEIVFDLMETTGRSKSIVLQCFQTP